MAEVAGIAAAASAIVSAVSLLLAELRARGRTAPLSDNEIREALLLLESRLRSWMRQAARTNLAARALLAEGADPDSRRALMGFAMSNSAAGLGVARLFADSDEGRSLRTLVSVYAPELGDLEERFDDRSRAVEAVLAMAGQPDAAWDQDVVHEMVDHLDRTQAALSDAADRVGAFIRESFPLGAG